MQTLFHPHSHRLVPEVRKRYTVLCIDGYTVNDLFRVNLFETKTVFFTQNIVVSEQCYFL